MKKLKTTLSLILLLATSTTFAAEQPKLVGDLQVHPNEIRLSHRRHPHSILVTAQMADGRSVDLTSQATFQSSNEKIASVSLLGWVKPIGSGATTVTVTAAGKSAQINVNVDVPDKPREYSFVNDVMPALSKSGCNAGSCHGYSLGKNGFKLSLRGSDSAFDHNALTDEFFERRINRHNPPASLLLSKPLGDVPHKGGVRFDHGSLIHEYLLGWIAHGAKSDVTDPVELESVSIYPENVVLRPGWQQQLQLLAHYSDGNVRDVTRLGIFTVNTGRVAAVTDEGLVTANELGETAIVARYERIFATSNFIVLQPSPSFRPTPLPKGNVIDKFVVKKLNDLNVKPSELADDMTFLRRVYLDLIGIQPTPDEVRAFSEDEDPNKRQRVIDELFDRPQFVDQWSLKWGDLLQVSRTRLSEPAVFAFREWIRGAIASNMPLDKFVRSILVSRGGVADDPTSAYFVVSQNADDTLQRATQVFCGSAHALCKVSRAPVRELDPRRLLRAA